MSQNQELHRLREEIDRLDRQLVDTFQARMSVVRAISALKGNSGLEIRDRCREETVIAQAQERCSEELREEAALLMEAVLSLSRSYQRRLLGLEESSSRDQ